MRKRFVKKDKVNFKICTLQNEKQRITIQILHNISRNKSNQTMKFGQSIEYNMRNNVEEKLVPDFFIKS